MSDNGHDEFEERPELVRKRARVIFWTRLAIAVGVFFVVAALGLLVYNAISSIQTRHTILDCTQPSGECYQDGQKRTGEFVSNLLTHTDKNHVITRRVIVYALACDNEPGIDTAREIQQCVDDKLAQDKR